MSDKKPAPALRQCRSLTVRGVQCRSTAITGQGLCHTHLHYRHPEFPQGPKIAVPLFEDHSAIQLATTQIAHGILTGQLDPARARALSYNCQVAAMTLPRPQPQRYKPLDGKPAADETVADITTAPDGSPLGPDLPWLGPDGKFEPTWSVSKYLYEKECERLQQKIPASADEYPESGWLTEEEMNEDPDAFSARYRERKRRLRLAAGEPTEEDLKFEIQNMQQRLAALEEARRVRESQPPRSCFAPDPNAPAWQKAWLENYLALQGHTPRHSKPLPASAPQPEAAPGNAKSDAPAGEHTAQAAPDGAAEAGIALDLKAAAPRDLSSAPCAPSPDPCALSAPCALSSEPCALPQPCALSSEL